MIAVAHRAQTPRGVCLHVWLVKGQRLAWSLTWGHRGLRPRVCTAIVATRTGWCSVIVWPIRAWHVRWTRGRGVVAPTMGPS